MKIGHIFRNTINKQTDFFKSEECNTTTMSVTRLGKVVDKEKVQKVGIPAYFKPPQKPVEQNETTITNQVFLV